MVRSNINSISIHINTSRILLCTESGYEVEDREAEKLYKFSLRHSLELAANKKFLAGISIYMTPMTKPPADAMKEVITLAGGKVLL